MLTLSPKARRFISEAFQRFPDAGYRDLWSTANQISPSPFTLRLVLAALAHFSAILEFELAKTDLSRESRVRFSNDLWFVSDLISEISESLPTGQSGDDDPYLPSLTGGAANIPPTTG
jgi:hypothetical protein